MKSPGPGKKKTFVMGKLIAKFRMAGMKPGSGGSKRRRTRKPSGPKPRGRSGRRRHARPKP